MNVEAGTPTFGPGGDLEVADMGSPAFDVMTTEGEDGVVMRISGDLDVSTAPRLREELGRLAGRGTSRVTLDLAALSFIDSTGLSVLVSAMKRCREMGGDVVLHSPHASTRKILEITGLTQVFTITGYGVAAT